ncbi:MAG: hypothetical protein JWM56_330 [Candidatus Peribacteria bacterium]|nr:hypothetical protein [Candidatus Peribacteria bacterium]
MRRPYLFIAPVCTLVIILAGVLVFHRKRPHQLAQNEHSSASAVYQSSHVSSIHSTPAYEPDWDSIPGALVRVGMKSKVGVLLDDIPEKDRQTLVDSLLLKEKTFWQEKAKRQIHLTSLRLSYRNDPKTGTKQLPLPPEEIWQIAIHGDPVRQNINGHDTVMVGYEFSGILLTDEQSPGESEPALRTVGGTWKESFWFPVDPEFIFQRTGFACMNESEFPPGSMDAEESDLFYDDRCTVEKKLSNTGCHQTAMPDESCVQVLDMHVGKVEANMVFERLAWNRQTASEVRRGHITNPDGADLEPYAEEFRQHRFTYKYIPENSCTLEEQCVGGSGWRRLLQFPTADVNAGLKPLDIGFVDYFLKNKRSVVSEHGVFEFSACHQHYHFSHYGTFSLGEESNAISHKNGFCLQPTARLANNEVSPLHHPYTDCLNQGVAPGWIDEYKMGLECQWIDISDVKTGQDLPLSFTTNPDGLLCEGTPIVNAKGEQLFQPTPFKTAKGEPVDRPQCNFYADWQKNNTDSYVVHIPEKADSYITDTCRDGLYGLLRNCGFTNRRATSECQPGKKVTMRCHVPSGSPTQTVRVCEASRVLQAGIPCTYNDALASKTVDAEIDISFICPSARDSRETGGSYSFLSGPLIPGGPSAEVTCDAGL